MDSRCPSVRDAFWSPTVLRWYRPSSHGGRIVPDVTRTIETPDVMYQKILHNPLVFSDHINPDARSILTGLLQRDPTKRLGANGAEEIKRHPFFSKHIDWHKYVCFSPSIAVLESVQSCGGSDDRVLSSCRLVAKKIQPPFKPTVVRLCLHLQSFHMSLYSSGCTIT